MIAVPIVPKPRKRRIGSISFCTTSFIGCGNGDGEIRVNTTSCGVGERLGVGVLVGVIVLVACNVTDRVGPPVGGCVGVRVRVGPPAGG